MSQVSTPSSPAAGKGWPCWLPALGITGSDVSAAAVSRAGDVVADVERGCKTGEL